MNWKPAQLSHRLLVPGSRHIRSLWTGRAPGATRDYERTFDWSARCMTYAHAYCSWCGAHLDWVRDGQEAYCLDCLKRKGMRLLFSERQQLRQRGWDWDRPNVKRRVCRAEGCATILSAYNFEAYCGAHLKEQAEENMTWVWAPLVGYCPRQEDE